MQTGKFKVSKNIWHFFITSFVLIIIILSAINISIYTKTNKVLGLSTENSPLLSKEDFWKDFLQKHPNYIPGHLEVGNKGEALEIDPNYVIP